MSKDPAFLFYSSDFLSGVVDLTMEERGQYITLLCLQHQKGRLSEKTIRLSLGNVSVDVLKKFQTDSEGFFFNNRLEEEIEKRIKFTESRRNNGSRGGRPKKEEKPNGLPYAKASENLTENENINENKDALKINKKEKQEIDFKILSEIEVGQAYEYVYFLGKKDILKDDIPNFWKAFILHKPDFDKESRSKQMQHFRDWLKFQKKQNLSNGTHQQTITTGKQSRSQQNSESVNYLLNSLAEDMQRIRTETDRTEI